MAEIPVRKTHTREQLHQAIGEAIEAYARVEQSLAELLSAIIEVRPRYSYVLFHAVQNTRSRNEMFQSLLDVLFYGKQQNLDTYWDSCSKYLHTLAKFRNAAAHWHPRVNIYFDTVAFAGKGVDAAIGPPNPWAGRGRSLTASSFPPFIRDCQYIKEELDGLTECLRDKPSSLPERYQKPLARQNEALLQQSRIAKEPQPLRKPSVPKLSRAQKRKKALKDARAKKK
jgi:hypothetical protein